MEENLNGTTFNIDEIIKSFCNFGFKIKIEQNVDFAHKMEQIWKGVKNPIIRKESVWKFRWNKYIGFSIYEVFGKGFFWHFSGDFPNFNFSHCQIYSEIEIEKMHDDIFKMLSSKFSKEELREIKLNVIGV